MIEKINKESVLTREFNKYFERKVMLEFQIKVQEQLDPKEMSAKKPLQFGQNGQPVSYKDIKRSEHIVMLQEQLENTELLLSTISELMK